MRPPNSHACSMQTERILVATRERMTRERAEMIRLLAEMLGMAETDCLDDKSNAWRSAMLNARALLARITE